MGEIEAAAPREQEFARRARHRVADNDAPAGARQRLGRHQPRRPGADDDHRRAHRAPACAWASESRRSRCRKERSAIADAADFRRIALSLPGAAEYPHFERRAFKARVTFATLAPDARSANLKFSIDEQALKCAVAADAFTPLDNAWGRRGWTRAELAALSEAELSAALEIAYRHAAPAQRSARSRRR
jgi:hypothetical protein